MNRQKLIDKVLTYIVFAIVFMIPFVWVLQTSFKTDSQILSFPPRIYPMLVSPDEFRDMQAQGELSPFQEKWGFAVTGRNYQRLFGEFPFLQFSINTVIIVLFTVMGTLISSCLCAYAFGCLRWPDRRRVFLLILATMILPYQVTMIPVFLIFRSLHMIDTFLPLIIPQFLGPPFFVFLLRQFFVGIPIDLLEASRIDGATEFQILTRVVIPLSKPALLTVAIFSGMFAWNDFLGPLIYLNSESSKTLALGLQSLVTQFNAEWGMLMAAGAVMIIPILVVFFFAQRYFIEGITLSGTKG